MSLVLTSREPLEVDGETVWQLGALEEAAELFAKVRNVQIVACGTSYHAGMVARYWLEELAGIPCQVEVASAS